MSDIPPSPNVCWHTAALENISTHVFGLLSEFDTVEDAVVEGASAGRSLSNAEIQRLQRLDFLRQSLQDLATLTSLLSRIRPSVSLTPRQVDLIASQLDLDATREILIAATHRHGPAPRPQPAGVVDLF